MFYVCVFGKGLSLVCRLVCLDQAIFDIMFTVWHEFCVFLWCLTRFDMVWPCEAAVSVGLLLALQSSPARPSLAWQPTPKARLLCTAATEKQTGKKTGNNLFNRREKKDGLRWYWRILVPEVSQIPCLRAKLCIAVHRAFHGIPNSKVLVLSLASWQIFCAALSKADAAMTHRSIPRMLCLMSQN